MAITEDWSTRWTYERLADRLVMTGADCELQLALSWNHRQETQQEEFEEDFRLGATRFYSDDFAADLSFENTAEFLRGKNRFITGVIPTFETESDASYSDADGNLGQLLAADRTYYLNLPFYLENQHYFTNSLSLLTGFQAVYINRVFKDRFDSPTLGNQSHEDRYLAFNPKLGLAYNWSPDSLAYLNLSRSFQPPSFDESLSIREGIDGGTVFHELHAQHAVTLEAGTRGHAGPFHWDLALYRSWVRDELLDQNNAQGQPLGTINAARIIHQGVEAGLEVELLHQLFLQPSTTTTAARSETDRVLLEQSYTLSDFHFDHSSVYGENQIAGTPAQFFKAELRYEHPRGFYFGVNVESSLCTYPVDEANTLYADAYALLGIRLGYNAKRGWQVFFEAKNLTNETYAASVEPIADARTGDVASFNPGNGRAFYGGLSWAW